VLYFGLWRNDLVDRAKPRYVPLPDSRKEPVMLSDADRKKAADILMNAEKTRKQATQLSVAFPDIDFDDAVGGMVGFGWRWIGVSYTNIKYHGPFAGSADASNVGVTVGWKF